MALVICATILQALLFLIFRVFEERRIALMPAIGVNYLVATVCGIIVAPPWHGGSLNALWLPSAGVGILFVVIFFLTGITTQRDGVAASTVASKMSVVLTVLFSVIVHGEDPGILGWSGLLFAASGVALASWTGNLAHGRRLSAFPVILFVGTACIDVSLNLTQRGLLTIDTEAIFPTLCTGFAGLFAFAVIGRQGSTRSLKHPAVWIGGSLLGAANYGTLYFVVKALAHSGMPASLVFPLISVGVILFGTLGSILLFKERPTLTRTLGISSAIIAVVLLILAR